MEKRNSSNDKIKLHLQKETVNLKKERWNSKGLQWIWWWQLFIRKQGLTHPRTNSYTLLEEEIFQTEVFNL